ncbi:MAG: hypothetical protein MHM6MM_002277 [Cercozoa sp. M6MM]
MSSEEDHANEASRDEIDERPAGHENEEMPKDVSDSPVEEEVEEDTVEAKVDGDKVEQAHVETERAETEATTETETEAETAETEADASAESDSSTQLEAHEETESEEPSNDQNAEEEETDASKHETVEGDAELPERTQVNETPFDPDVQRSIEELDHLNVRNDQLLQRFFMSINSDSASTSKTASECEERVLFSVLTDTAILCDDHASSRHNTSDPSESGVKRALVLTDLALYLFPPPMEVDGQNFLVVTEYEQIPLATIRVVSIPFASQITTSGHDFAIRTCDFAMHLTRHRTLWLTSEAETRSPLLESICEAFQNSTGAQLSLQHVERTRLLDSVHSGEIWQHVEQIEEREWAQQEPLLCTHCEHQRLEVGKAQLRADAWRRVYLALYTQRLRIFSSRAELEAWREVARTPATQKARAPKVPGQSDLPLHQWRVSTAVFKRSVSQLDKDADHGLELRFDECVTVDGQVLLSQWCNTVHLLKFSSQQEMQEWFDAVQNRRTLAVQKEEDRIRAIRADFKKRLQT